jgi:hypothetical protein
MPTTKDILSLSQNKRFLQIAEEHNIAVTPEILHLAKSLISSCAEEAKRSQDWNENMSIKLNIDQCILCEFGL